MSSPPDFLGFALANIAAQRNQRAQTQQQAMEQARFEAQMREHQAVAQREALKTALGLVAQGYDEKAITGIVGSDLAGGQMLFVREAIKKQKQMEKQQQAGQDISAEIPTIASQAVMGQDVTPALGRLQTGVMGAFAPDQQGEMIGRLQTGFNAEYQRQLVARQQADAAAKSQREKFDYELRKKTGASLYLSQQADKLRAASESGNMLVPAESVPNLPAGMSGIRGPGGTMIVQYRNRDQADQLQSIGAVKTGTQSGVSLGGGDVGKPNPQIFQLENKVANTDASLARVARVEDLMQSNRELFGAAGAAGAAIKGLFGVAGDIGNLQEFRNTDFGKRLEALRQEYDQDLVRLRSERDESGKPLIENEAYNALASVIRNDKRGVVDLLRGMLIYDVAKLNDPSGRVSNDDYKAAAKEIEIRGFSPTEDFGRTVGRVEEYKKQLMDSLEFDMKRLDQFQARGQAVTITRDALRSKNVLTPAQPGTQLPPDLQKRIDKINKGR